MLSHSEDELNGMGLLIMELKEGQTPGTIININSDVAFSNTLFPDSDEEWFIENNILSIAPQQLLVGNTVQTYIWIGTAEGGSYRYNMDTGKIDVHLTVRNTGCYGNTSLIQGETISFNELICKMKNSICDNNPCDRNNYKGVTSSDKIVLQMNSELDLINSWVVSPLWGKIEFCPPRT
jgi:hypothetical protein